MYNREVFLKDPSKTKLANDGVASVSDGSSKPDLDVLRFELETFVCEGQYNKGLVRILDSFLTNVDKPTQPAVWVSGFYGCGKSHLVKMLRALWNNTELPGGASAIGVANLSQDVKDLLKALERKGTNNGGLHAASGTLGMSAMDKSVRLSILSIIFKSVGLPQDYAVARFVMWLKHEGILEDVKSHIAANGRNWESELDHFWVATGLPAAITAVKPDAFPTVEAYNASKNNMFPKKLADIDQDEMVTAIRDALSKNGKFPLTLIVLDEVQQYIGQNNQRSLDVQLAVEACCKAFSGKLLFVGTGQSAIQGTANLKKLQGRFTVPIELESTDVDTVVRKVILAKKPEAYMPIRNIMEENLGEISKHLLGTIIAHQQSDVEDLPKDYPLLPVRRRFWNLTLRALDVTGVSNQLRNYLTIIHKAVCTNLDDQLGNVVPADFLFFESAPSLRNSGALPQRVYEETARWIDGTDDEKLKARAIALVFLINSQNVGNDDRDGIGIRATVENLADLIVSDISKGGSDISSRLPSLLDECDLVMKIRDEYRIRTNESSQWHTEFQGQRKILANESHRIDAVRSEYIKSKFENEIKGISILQGITKVARKIDTYFSSTPPADNDKIILWIQDGWNMKESAVLDEARRAGSESCIIYVYIPRKPANTLADCLTDYIAAKATLDRLGAPSTTDGRMARSAMETTRDDASSRVDAILKGAFDEAKVFQGGGSQIFGSSIKSSITEAVENAVVRLYPEFRVADKIGWDKVLTAAKNGAQDALKYIGDQGDPVVNPICKLILSFLGQGRQGRDIRSHFELPPYGWSRDAIDGALHVLANIHAINIFDDSGHAVQSRSLERNAIGKTWFRTTSVNITIQDRIVVRKVFQKAGIAFKINDESAVTNELIQCLRTLAESAGGTEPKPIVPDISLIEKISGESGLGQLKLIADNSESLLDFIDHCVSIAEKIKQRLPRWETVKKLSNHASGISEAQEILARIKIIEQERQLLLDPDPVEETITSLTQILRDAVNTIIKIYDENYSSGQHRLTSIDEWQLLDTDKKNALLIKHNIHEVAKPFIDLSTPDALLLSLDKIRLESFHAQADALPARFDKLVGEIISVSENEIPIVTIPKKILTSQEAVTEWIEEVNSLLVNAIANGPIKII
jgi:hypothetical protein